MRIEPKTRLVVSFLLTLKEEIAMPGKENQATGGHAVLAAMERIDDAVELLTRQETEIKDLKLVLEMVRKDNREYHKRYGGLNEYDFDDGE